MSQDFQIDQLELSRSHENAFAPHFYNNTLYFSLDRINGRSSKGDHLKFLDIYQKDLSSDTSEVIPASEFNTFVNDGPIVFAKNGNLACITRNLNIPKSPRDHSSANGLGLFFIEKQGDSWSKPKPFKYNSDRYDCAHASLNERGDTLFYTCNMSGGKGGADLYLSVLEDGNWSVPRNLGKNVNSSSSESYPFFVDGYLYFSSNRKNGKGGIDLYRCKLNQKGEFDPAEILKAPINSSADDFGFYKFKGEEKGYFSSSRDQAHDHVYKWELVDPMPSEFVDSEVNFCYQITDAKIEEDPNYSYEWKIGKDVVKAGRVIEHCFTDEGQYEISLSISEKHTGRKFENVSQLSVNVEAEKIPIIVAKLNGKKLALTIDNKYCKDLFDKYIWIVEGDKYYGDNLQLDYNGNITIKLVGYDSKNLESNVGVKKDLAF